MTQLNGLLFAVTVVDANNFTIGVDTTGYSTYTSGGTAQKELIYAAGGDDTWRFTQFGPLAIAVNGVDIPQAAAQEQEALLQQQALVSLGSSLGKIPLVNILA